MLIHIVCWKYKLETTAAARDEHVAMLAALPETIECISTFQVGRDILHLERSFDTGLVAGFKDQAALDEYTVHSDHQKVAAIGKQIAEKVVSVDFLTGDHLSSGASPDLIAAAYALAPAWSGWPTAAISHRRTE